MLIAVWVAFALLVLAISWLQRTPWGRVLRAIREDEDAARALGKNVFVYKLQSLMIAAALGAVAGYFLALNVTIVYPNEFEPTFTFFGYAILVLGGFASYFGVIAGALLLWTILEGTRLVQLPVSARPGRGDPVHGRRLHPRRTHGAEAAGASSASGRRCCSDVTEPILQVDAVVKRFGGLRAVDGAGFRDPGRVGDGADRAERRGQDDAVQRPHGLLPRRRRAHRLPRPADRAEAAARDRKAGDGTRLPDHEGPAAVSVLDNMLLAGHGLPGERLLGATFRRAATSRREREVPRAGARTSGGVRPCFACHGVRRQPLGRPAKAARSSRVC